MKKVIFKLASYTAMLAVAALAFTACSDDDEPTTTTTTGAMTYVDGVYELNGLIDEDVVLESGKSYSITGPVIIEEGGSLTVSAGLTITAEAGFSKYILVDRGGKIYVNGTASAPVTFTAADGKSNWGGIIINGYAPVSGEATSGNEGATEISNAYAYGGTNSADNSGSLTYVILDLTGAKSSGSIEHNGLTLNGVGSGTTIENIYIPSTADDGVEFFGGSVNVTNLLVVNSDDDMFDFTQGYKGTLKNCYGVWESGYSSEEGDPRGVEADGNLDGLATDTDYNQSNFTIENMTIQIDTDFEMHDAIKIRRGATATIKNALVTGSGAAPADLIDLYDSKGTATASTVINVTSDLKCADTIVTPAEEKATSYTGITISTSNTGCTADFSWSGYTL